MIIEGLLKQGGNNLGEHSIIGGLGSAVAELLVNIDRRC